MHTHAAHGADLQHQAKVTPDLAEGHRPTPALASTPRAPWTQRPAYMDTMGPSNCANADIPGYAV